MGRGADRTRLRTHGARALTPEPARAVVAVEALEERHRAAWGRAYAAYAREVDSPVDDAIAATVWSWLRSADPALEGIVATVDGAFAGFAHFRAFPRTLDGNEAGYLDDLWVDPAHRGSHVVRALFARLDAVARERAWTHVRWVTSEDNAHARRLYERIARDARLVTYRMNTSDRR